MKTKKPSKLQDLVFDRLHQLPAEHPYWVNAYMFTRPVFLNYSRMGESPAAFWAWVRGEGGDLKRLVMSALANAQAVATAKGADGTHDTGQ